jgi:hypothetical protein
MKKLNKIIQGIKSLWCWRKVIWNNDWYDYGFLLDLIEHQLKLMTRDENKSYTVSWDKYKNEMKDSLALLEQYRNCDDWDVEQEWFDEFIGSLKTMRYWWD